MSHTKSYAALSATTALEAYSFDRRALGENDVQVEILYCGVCHSDLHQAKNEWGGCAGSIHGTSTCDGMAFLLVHIDDVEVAIANCAEVCVK